MNRKKEAGWINPQIGKPRPSNKKWFTDGVVDYLIDPVTAPSHYTLGRSKIRKSLCSNDCEELTFE